MTGCSGFIWSTVIGGVENRWTMWQMKIQSMEEGVKRRDGKWLTCKRRKERIISSATEEKPRVLRNTEFHSCFHKNLPRAFHLCPGLLSCLFPKYCPPPLSPPPKNPVCISLCSCDSLLEWAILIKSLSSHLGRHARSRCDKEAGSCAAVQ
jgi:hypothetical protein